MGFVMGTSLVLQSPIYHPRFPPSSQSVFLYSDVRNANTKMRNKAPMASLGYESSNDSDFCKRRAVLFVGISILPFLHLKARAFEGLETEERELRTLEENQKAEKEPQRSETPNPFLSLLNVLGVSSSGVFGALYALAQKEKKVSEAAMESIKNTLKEKEAAIVTMEKDFRLKFQNEQEERTKQLNKAKEGQQVLTNQLKSANSTIKGLGQELQAEKRLIEELKVQIDSLQTDVSKAEEDKKVLQENMKEKLNSIKVLQERIDLLSLEIKDKEDNIGNLRSSLAEKELEFNNLNAMSKRTKDELEVAKSEIKGLKEELMKNKSELESKMSEVDDLNARVSSLIVERDDFNRRVGAIQVEYNDLKLSSEKKAALDAKLLEEKKEQLQQLEKKLKLGSSEASKNQAIIASLTKERDDLRKMLDTELNNVKNVNHELQIMQETLGASRNEASDLEKQLNESKKLCIELEAEVSRVQAEFAEARKSFQMSLEEAKQSGEVLAGKFTTTKELLKKTEDELRHASDELATVTEDRDSLRKELVDVYKKAENAAHDLREEKKVVATLNKELQTLEKQILKDNEARKSLDIDLEEATKSLDEMNRNAFTLSKDLEMANSRISNLEDEKDVLYKSLAEQKNVTQEARENMEDAHNLLMRLGKEREGMEKRTNKLEQELGSAKGEILRLRSKMNSSKALVSDKHQQKEEAEGKVAVSAKKVGRRKKSDQQ